ncbi:unnamed protein product, partial [Linum tenue]
PFNCFTDLIEVVPYGEKHNNSHKKSHPIPNFKQIENPNYKQVDDPTRRRKSLGVGRSRLGVPRTISAAERLLTSATLISGSQPTSTAGSRLPPEIRCYLLCRLLQQTVYKCRTRLTMSMYAQKKQNH